MGRDRSAVLASWAVTALGENKTSGVDPEASAVSQKMSLLREGKGIRQVCSALAFQKSNTLLPWLLLSAAECTLNRKTGVSSLWLEHFTHQQSTPLEGTSGSEGPKHCIVGINYHLYIVLHRVRGAEGGKLQLGEARLAATAGEKGKQLMQPGTALRLGEASLTWASQLSLQLNAWDTAKGLSPRTVQCIGYCQKTTGVTSQNRSLLSSTYPPFLQE